MERSSLSLVITNPLSPGVGKTGTFSGFASEAAETALVQRRIKANTVLRQGDTVVNLSPATTDAPILK